MNHMRRLPLVLRFSRTAAAARTTTMTSRRLLSSSTSNDKPANIIGFVGLGNMGLPMCRNLLLDESLSSSTTKVLAFDAHHVALDEAKLLGAQPAGSLREIGEAGCSVIFTMLPGCSAVNDVMSVLLESSSNNNNTNQKCVFVDCSTVAPTTSIQWHERVTAQSNGRQHAMLDAPVSGGVKGAQEGTLTFMVGCNDETALETARPFLDVMGSRIIPCGGAGTGSAVKLCNNLALAAQMIGICEAMNLGEGLGVDPVVLADVLNTSTAKCWSSQVNQPHPVVAERMLEESGVGPPASRNYQGGFGTSLMLKDLGLAVSAGQDAGVALPLGGLSKELYRMAKLRGLGDKDFGVMLQLLRGE